MIGRVIIRERGAAPRGFRRVWNAASKTAWFASGEFFDDNLRDRRFTTAHAIAAGYKKRKGELQPVGSKSRRKSYTGRKEAKYKHSRPLEFSGDTREALRSGGRVVTTSKGARVRYPQARAFSYRHPKSQINMQEEFRTLLPEEEMQLGRIYDSRLDQELEDANWQSITSVG